MTVERIMKRDGRTASFDLSKISDAISRAFAATYKPGSEEIAKSLAEEVLSILEMEGKSEPDVEHIQDIVERVLMDNSYVQTAKAYILYRAERSRIREMNTRLMKRFEEITFTDTKDSNIKRENANINGDTAMGSMLKYGQEGAKQFYDMFVLNPEHARLHREGDIHIHDLDFLTLTTTCCQIDVKKLFKGGFSTGHGKLREPNDIASYAALACIAVQSNQNDQHGGQSIVNFDYGMADGVKKTYKRIYRQNLARAFQLLCGSDDIEDAIKRMSEEIESECGLAPSLENNGEYLQAELPRLTEIAGCTVDEAKKAQEFALYRARKETNRATFQAMEALIHNLNTMNSRAGAQTPFSTINYGMDTSPEGRMVIKNVLLTTEQGLGDGETPIFPIQVFRVKSGINLNEGEPNYDLFKLACRCSAKRLFPNFAFLDAPFNADFYKEGVPETEIAYMGCRTRVMANVYDPDNAVSYGRGNLSFTSVNLPRLAIKAKGDISIFFETLDNRVDQIIAQLLERFEIQSKKRVKNYPFLMGEGVWIGSDKLSWEDEVGEVLKHGSLSLGFIGLAETLKSLTGYHHGENPMSQNLGLEIIGHMRKRLDDASRKYKLNFTLLATPGEGLSGRFVEIDRDLYGSIPGVTDKEYYTNSFHIPVYFEIPAFEKIKLEAPYHNLTNAGHITYIEMDGDPLDNLEAFEKVIRYMSTCGVGYGSVNHPVDRDPVCGFSGIIKDQCPGCGRQEDEVGFVRIRRVTGYLGSTLDRFNNSKKAEVRDRLTHGIRNQECGG